MSVYSTLYVLLRHHLASLPAPPHRKYPVRRRSDHLLGRVDPIDKAHQSDGKSRKDNGEDLAGHIPQLDASESLSLVHLGLIDVMMMVMMFVMIMLMLR